MRLGSCRPQQGKHRATQAWGEGCGARNPGTTIGRWVESRPRESSGGGWKPSAKLREIRVGNGRWVEVEGTPGIRERRPEGIWEVVPPLGRIEHYELSNLDVRSPAQ